MEKTEVVALLPPQDLVTSVLSHVQHWTQHAAYPLCTCSSTSGTMTQTACFGCCSQQCRDIRARGDRQTDRQTAGSTQLQAVGLMRHSSRSLGGQQVVETNLVTTARLTQPLQQPQGKTDRREGRPDLFHGGHKLGGQGQAAQQQAVLHL